MKKLKDILYDKSDLFVALIIIAVAGAVIWFGVTSIMAYPGKVSMTEKASVEVTTPSAQENPSTTASGTEGAADDTLGIIIAENETAEQVANKLVSLGLIEKPEDFITSFNASDRNTIQPGSFDIPANASIDDIIAIIAK